MKKIFFILSFLISLNCLSQNKKSLLRNGNELYNDSSYNEAEMKYRKSLEKDQDYFSASFNLADAVYKQDRYKESSALFDALKDDAPSKIDLAKVYHNLGNSLVKEQKIEEAIDAYKSALRINPKDKDTRHNLAITQKKKQQQEKEQENKEENKDEQEQDKDGENKDEEKQNKDQEQNQENKEDKQEKKPEEKKEEMSKETAEKMLEAIQQQEKELQEELQKKKVKGKRIKVLKDW
jgi:tetratricopeptide (TPR) repeat protein|tara:strand:+ start:566 stop:1273 length:708 start_codon:yes stop_codon:yes gene_type:complete